MFWFWGTCGAFVYAAPFLVLSLWADGQDKAGRWKAFASFVVSLVTGCIFAEGFTRSVEQVVMKLVNIDVTAIALIVGVASNYIWPKLLRRLGTEIDKAIVKRTGLDTESLGL